MQEEKDDFYIGWQPKAEKSFSSPNRNVAIALACLAVLVPLLLVINQRGFADSVFEYGKPTKIKGILSLEPVPMLKVGDQSVLLVSLGKFGGEKGLERLYKQEIEGLEGRILGFEGTKIYHDGKSAFEINPSTELIIENIESTGPWIIDKKELGKVKWKGEILDPKCALGVMKPGYGKPHRSCAIRCISGGIPPIFRVKMKDGDNVYAIITGANGEPINQQLIPFVADQVELCGDLEQQDDWYVLKIDPERGIRRLSHFGTDQNTSSCGN